MRSISLLDEAIGRCIPEYKDHNGHPTAAPPSWLQEIPRSTEVAGGRSPAPLAVASTASIPRYREETERIVGIYVDHYGKTPIIAWQADNEYGCHGSALCYCNNCAGAFREWLREVRNSDNLNQMGNGFLSNICSDWEDKPSQTRSCIIQPLYGIRL